MTNQPSLEQEVRSEMAKQGFIFDGYVNSVIHGPDKNVIDPDLSDCLDGMMLPGVCINLGPIIHFKSDEEMITEVRPKIEHVWGKCEIRLTTAYSCNSNTPIENQRAVYMKPLEPLSQSQLDYLKLRISRVS